MFPSTGEIMLDGVLNGIYAGLGVGIGVLVSRLIVRPFIEEKVEPYYNIFKKRFKRILYSDDYGRTLSTQELLWAEDAAANMVAEVSKGDKLGFIRGSLYLIIGLLVFLLSTLIFSGATTAVIKAFLFQEQWGALSWYRVETVGSSTILGIFVAICFTWWLCVSVHLLTQNPARHFKSFFGNYQKNSRSYWKSIIIELIRKRSISTDVGADIILIGKVPFRQHSVLSGILTVILSGLVIILLFLDLKNSTVIYKNHIDHSPYTSLLTRSYTAHDIVEVKRTCHIIVNAKNQSTPRTNLKYKLLMSDGRKVTIYGRDEGASLHYQIRAIEHWHNVIPADKISPLNITSTHPKRISATQSQCASITRRHCHSGCEDALMKVFGLNKKNTY